MTKIISLSDLVGTHLLKGVDEPAVGEHKLADWIRFQLDDQAYYAEEDPSDDYRSYLDRIEETDAKVTNTFRGVRVVGRMAQPSHNQTILELVHARTEKVILRVGTDNVDDYYPSWVAQWWPEHLKA